MGRIPTFLAALLVLLVPVLAQAEPADIDAAARGVVRVVIIGEDGEELVSTSFIIPYPPGFPILVPGQVISPEILSFMRALDVSEIHGFRADLGLRVFTKEALKGFSCREP